MDRNPDAARFKFGAGGKNVCAGFFLLLFHFIWKSRYNAAAIGNQQAAKKFEAAGLLLIVIGGA